MPNRSKRVVLLAHCVLNQNAKVAGLAKESGIVLPIMTVLSSYGLGVIQLPCPEMAMAGVRRWWQTKRQYDIPGFRRYCREQAVAVVDQMEDYHKNGYEIVAILGVDGSPTCGISFCGTDADLGGPPHVPDPSSALEEKGILMEELTAEISHRGLPVPQVFGLGIEGDRSTEDVAAELDRFLKHQFLSGSKGG